MTSTGSNLAVPIADATDMASQECWRSIGVFGEASCAKLSQYVHCRNCPVYARAGTALLNRATPANYRRDWAAHFATPKRGAATANTSATLFRIGTEWLALDTMLFQEVAEHRPMHTLPRPPTGLGIVLGLVNVRGELLICVSLGRLLEIDHELPCIRPREGFRRMLVVNADPHRFAFPVDEVYGVHRFNREELEEPPATVARASRSFARGVFRWRAPARRATPGGATEHTVGYIDNEALLLNLERNLS